eukprot:CAMPEP_0113253112 /NCGR_PEP_ID=MMETSP0008_2-20120614/12993_1 /TAXON_ID=97485 /ORGANISM="Prymnesium parvum" /LENGTH=123 /DNA_ID=CAMNT_0000101239 /DNA_START=88 /DNA_END=459 /DNA_ORIENTATION=- /assembly_acc=CAM_ASM_000153
MSIVALLHHPPARDAPEQPVEPDRVRATVDPCCVHISQLEERVIEQWRRHRIASFSIFLPVLNTRRCCFLVTKRGNEHRGHPNVELQIFLSPYRPIISYAEHRPEPLQLGKDARVGAQRTPLT